MRSVEWAKLLMAHRGGGAPLVVQLVMAHRGSGAPLVVELVMAHGPTVRH